MTATYVKKRYLLAWVGADHACQLRCFPSTMFCYQALNAPPSMGRRLLSFAVMLGLVSEDISNSIQSIRSGGQWPSILP